jgi:hypothetical protein
MAFVRALRTLKRPSPATVQAFAVSAAATLFLVGCAAANTDVRALRMYERERVTPALLRAHLAQLDHTLGLIDTLVHDTQYEPGEAWIKALPLSEATAGQAAQALAAQGATEGKATVLELYGSHIEDLLKRVPKKPDFAALAAEAATAAAPATTDAANAEATAARIQNQAATAEAQSQAAQAQNQPYSSITEALSQVNPNLGNAVPPPQQPLNANAPPTPGALAQQAGRRVLQSREVQQVYSDALSITSVALRLALEASGLAAVVVAEASSLAHQPAGDWLRSAPDAVQLVQEAPNRLRSINQKLDADATALKKLVGALAQLEKIDPSDAPGYLYREGLVDDIVGFGWDSVHLQAEAGGEAYFYNSLADKETSSHNGDTYDYTGRTFKLVYHVDPIILATAKLSAKVDFGHLPDAGGLKFGYATNRVYHSGGDIQGGTLAGELGVHGEFSDALDAALFVAGVKAKVRIARFTSGTVDLVEAATGTVDLTAPFSFSEKQIELSYDFVPRNDSPLQSLSVGLGYFDYTLPRILYELQNVTPDLSNASYVYSRETPPQAVRTRLAMLGLTTRLEQPATPTLTAFFAANFAVGLGPMSYYFLKDTTLPDDDSNRDNRNQTTVGLGINGALGVRWRFVGGDSRFNAHLEASYQVQFLDNQLSPDKNKDTIVNSGSVDVFHGPTAALGGSY